MGDGATSAYMDLRTCRRPTEYLRSSTEHAQLCNEGPVGARHVRTSVGAWEFSSWAKVRWVGVEPSHEPGVPNVHPQGCLRNLPGCLHICIVLCAWVNQGLGKPFGCAQSPGPFGSGRTSPRVPVSALDEYLQVGKQKDASPTIYTGQSEMLYRSTLSELSGLVSNAMVPRPF